MLVSVMGCLALFCSKGATDNRVVAWVGREPIRAFELAQVLPGQKDSLLENRKEQLLDQMINQKLFVIRAWELGYQETLAGALEKKKGELLRQALEKYARALTPTKQDVAQESLRFLTDVHLKLIEVATWDTVRIVQLLLQQGVPFESLAVRYSEAKIPAPDGDLGFVPMSRLPPEILEALKQLKSGETGFLVTRMIYYDFIKLVATRRSAIGDSIVRNLAQIEASARQRKTADFMAGIRNRVQYDEAALDYLTRLPDSSNGVTTPLVDSLLVVARRADGYKTRIRALLPLVRKYGDVYPALKRKALKEEIENDLLDQAAGKLGLDKAPEYRRQLKMVAEGGIYQFFYGRQVNALAQPGDSEIAAYFQDHPEVYPGNELTPAAANEIRTLLSHDKQQQRYQALEKELHQKTRIVIDRKVLKSIKPARPEGSGTNK
jgi:hypothetical protein